MTEDDEPNKYFGQSFLGFTWEPSKCLPIFYKWLQDNGVTILNKTVSNLEELEADFIINCSGIGARDLVSDENIFPISGHVLRVKNKTSHQCMTDDRPDTWSYIIPNTDTLVLGSVDKVDNWNTEPCDEDRNMILTRCDVLQPALGIKVDKSVSKNVPLLQPPLSK